MRRKVDAAGFSAASTFSVVGAGAVTWLFDGCYYLFLIPSFFWAP